MSEYALRVEKLNKTYGEGRSAVKAVDDISFSVERGSIALIMGPSGSGKTTLLTMIGSLLTPDSGKIYYGEIETVSLPKKALSDVRSRKVGFVFQSFNLLSALNVWENVAVVLELMRVPSREARQKAIGVLTELGLNDRLTYRIADLSGGEKQRVSIARALVTNPDVILADEPTANLDSKSGHKVMELLTRIAKESGKAVIIVSHDLRLMDIADRVLWLEDGKLREGKSELVRDSTCTMMIQKNTAPFSKKVGNEEYFFCSKKCYDDFKK